MSTPWNWHEKFVPALAQILEPEVYLEIGILRAETIRKVSARRKIGVDITKMFVGEPEFEFHEMSSDAYFDRVRSQRPFVDLAFIDGDHSEKQSLQDFTNCFEIVRDNGLILMHDSYPKTPDRAVDGLCGEIWKTARWIRQALGYKCEIVTIPVDAGLSIIRKTSTQVPWEEQKISGPCTYCGDPEHWRPDCPEIAELVRKKRAITQNKQ